MAMMKALAVAAGVVVASGALAEAADLLRSGARIHHFRPARGVGFADNMISGFTAQAKLVFEPLAK